MERVDWYVDFSVRVARFVLGLLCTERFVLLGAILTNSNTLFPNPRGQFATTRSSASATLVPTTPLFRPTTLPLEGVWTYCFQQTFCNYFTRIRQRVCQVKAKC